MAVFCVFTFKLTSVAVHGSCCVQQSKHAHYIYPNVDGQHPDTNTRGDHSLLEVEAERREHRMEIWRESLFILFQFYVIHVVIN